MLGHRPAFFASLPIIALAFCVCALSALARADNPFAESFIAQRAIFSVPLLWDTHWATTLYYAAQSSRPPMLEETSNVWLFPPATAGAASLAFLPASLMPAPLANAPLEGFTFRPNDTASGGSAARESFASGINSADTGDETKQRAESSALFYSATNAPNASSENFIRESSGQTRTGRTAAGSPTAPSAAGVFPLSGM